MGHTATSRASFVTYRLVPWVSRILVSGSILGSLAAGVQAATFVVTKTADTADGVCSVADCSLREAILAANAAGGRDTVSIPAGTYFLSRAGRREDGGLVGDLDVTEAVILQGAGAAVTVVDAGDLDRVLDLCPTGCATGSENEVHDLTLRNGFLDSDDDFTGAGVRVLELTTRFFDCVVRDNAHDVSLNGIEGGGIGSQPPVAIHLTRTTVSDNLAFGGAGIRGGPLYLTDSTVSNNFATGSVGGIRGSRSLIVNRSAIIGNDGPEGAGIYITDELSLVNSTVGGNLNGPGVYVVDGTAAFDNSTLVGTGQPALNVESGAVAEFTNTIVAGECQGFGTRVSLGHNLDSGDTCNFTESTDLVDTDPMLGPLSADPAFPPVHPLLAGSPAIGAGGGSCEPVDQRSVPRVNAASVCGDCDIGAYEVESVSRTCVAAYVIGSGSYLKAVELSSLREVASLSLQSPAAMDLNGDESRLYVAGALSVPAGGLSGYVAFLDASSATVLNTAFLPMVPTAVAAHPSEPRLYVAGTDGPFDATLVEVDADTAQILRTVPLNSATCTNGGIDPLDMVVSESTGSLITSVLTDGFFTGPIVYSLATLTETDCLPGVGDALDVSPGGDILYVSDPFADEVKRFDLRTGTSLGSVPTDDTLVVSTDDIAVSADGGSLYMAGEYQPGILTALFNAVVELDTASGGFADVTYTTHFPLKVAVSPDERYLAYLGSGQNALFVEDRDQAVIDQVAMPASPIDVEIVGRDRSLVFASGFEDGTTDDWDSVNP